MAEIVKSELKTIHTVCIPLDELNERLKNAKIYTSEPTELTKAGIAGMWQLTSNQAYEIANQLGFQKWENIGLFDEKRNEYIIVLSDNQNTIGKEI